MLRQMQQQQQQQFSLMQQQLMMLTQQYSQALREIIKFHIPLGFNMLFVLFTGALYLINDEMQWDLYFLVAAGIQNGRGLN